MVENHTNNAAFEGLERLIFMRYYKKLQPPFILIIRLFFDQEFLWLLISF